MPRVKRGTTHVKRRKTLLKKVKGFKWGRKNKIKLAKTAVTRAGVNAYRGRKQKKRDQRTTWNIQINAAVRPYEMSYSKFINALKVKNIGLNRKVLSEVAQNYPEVFEKIMEAVKK